MRPLSLHAVPHTEAAANAAETTSEEEDNLQSIQEKMNLLHSLLLFQPTTVTTPLPTTDQLTLTTAVSNTEPLENGAVLPSPLTPHSELGGAKGDARVARLVARPASPRRMSAPPGSPRRIPTCECAAVCCSVLRCVAVCWSAAHCSDRLSKENVCTPPALQGDTRLASVLQCVVVCCSLLQCVAVCCCASCCTAWLSKENVCTPKLSAEVPELWVCWSVLQCPAVSCSVFQ